MRDPTVERARQVADLAAQALLWIQADPSMAQRSETASLRRTARLANRLATAAARPPCVAVFGASQAGKSYLVANLASPSDRPLTVRYGPDELSFLADMNPPGGRESTGLVSRFTLRPPASPAGAPPVPVRMLGQTDIVRIIANAFLSDFQPRDAAQPTPETTAQRLVALRSTAGGSPFSKDDVEDLREYFYDHFRSHATIQALGESYWRQLADIAEALPLRDCVQAFAPLWGDNARFSDLATTLIGALDELGFPDIAFCGIEVLRPRKQSILDVTALFELGTTATASIAVVSANGRSGCFDRAVVAALVAELIIPLAEAAWPFLDRTDLLDFPGARSRESITDLDQFLAKPEQLGHIFLRGKVAYLFQRYQAEQEITAMLLCVADSVQDVQTLPGMVNDWVNQVLGKSPEERSRQRDSLFVVLTKFDREFSDKAGEDPTSGERWTARMNASQLNYFRFPWVDKWKPDRPFDNVCWLRSTSTFDSPVFDYDISADGAKRDRGVTPRAAALVADCRKAYLANTLVASHVRDPAQAWDEVLKPGDGGISFLAGRLAPVCDATLKLEQIAARVERLAAEMAGQLRPHHRSGDVAAEIAKARLVAMQVARPLTECASRQMFGPLLRALQVSRDQMIEVWRELQMKPGQDPAPIGAASQAGSVFDDLFGGSADAATAASPAPLVRDRHAQFADIVIETWERLCRDLAAAAATPASFRLPPEQAQALVAGLIGLERRLEFGGRLAARLRAECSHQSRITMTARL
jgi:hypothetical protein